MDRIRAMHGALVGEPVPSYDGGYPAPADAGWPVFVDAGQGQGFHYKDTRDNGNDPWVAGCHLEYTDPACTMGGATGYGDQCLPNGLDLIEWHDQNCHPSQPLDSQIWYCDFECMTRYNKPGRCVVENIQCGNGMIPSAKCECLNAGGPDGGVIITE